MAIPVKWKLCLLLPPLLIALALGGYSVSRTKSVPLTVIAADWLVEESDITQGGLGQVVVKVENTGEAPITYLAHAPGDPLWAKGVRDETGKWTARDGAFTTLAAGMHTLGPGESFSFTTEMGFLIDSEDVCPIGVYYLPGSAERQSRSMARLIENWRYQHSWLAPSDPLDRFHVAFSTDPLLRDRPE